MTDRRTRRPVRCEVRGCPMLGFWPSGRCPEHLDDPPPRQVTGDERWDELESWDLPDPLGRVFNAR